MARSAKWLLAAAALFAAPAQAGVYSDDLGKCLVAKSDAADQAVLMRWIFSALAASPIARSMANISAAQHNQANTAVASLFKRLLTVDCRSQAIAAVKYDNLGALQQGFELLGKVAMVNLTSDPEVAKQMAAVDTETDAQAYADLLKEAGIVPPAKPGGSPAK